jgi:hypothetical protein
MQPNVTVAVPPAARRQSRWRVKLADVLAFMVLVAAGCTMVGNIRISIFNDQDRLLVALFWLGLAAGILVDRLRGTRFRYAMLSVLLAMLLGFVVLHTQLWHAYFASNYRPGALRSELPGIAVTLSLCEAFAVLLAAMYRLITALLAAGPSGCWAWARRRPQSSITLALTAGLIALVYGGWSWWEANGTWRETASFVAYPNDPGYRHAADRITVSHEGGWIAVSGIRHNARNSREVHYGQIAICHWQEGPQPLPDVLRKNESAKERTVSFSPDDDLLMVADGTDTLRLIDPEDASVVREMTLEAPILEATWLHDGKFSTRTRSMYDTVEIRDLRDVSAPVQGAAGSAAPPNNSYQSTDPNARFFVQTDDKQIVVSRLSDQRTVATIPGNTWQTPPIYSLDGRLMIVGDVLCDLENGDQVTVPRKPAYRALFVTRDRVVGQAIFPEVLQLFDRFSNWLPHVPLIYYSANLIARRRILLFDVRSGRVLARTRLFREPIYSIGVSHDGRVMAAMIGERIYVWDVPQ